MFQGDLASDKAQICLFQGDLATDKAQIWLFQGDLASDKAQICSFQGDLASDKAQIWMKIEAIDGFRKGNISFNSSTSIQYLQIIISCKKGDLATS